MRMKNKETGEIVGMRYDPAMAAFAAGTHDFADEESASTDVSVVASEPPAATVPTDDDDGGNADDDTDDTDGGNDTGGGDDSDGESDTGNSDADAGDGGNDPLDAMTKDALLAEARARGRDDLKPAMSKAEILAALKTPA